MILRRTTLVVAMGASCPSLVAQRKPLSITPLVRLEVAPTPMRSKLTSDGRTWVRYNPDLRVESRPESGDFVFSWLMESGRRQAVVYRPRWQVSPVITAEVSWDSVTA